MALSFSWRKRDRVAQAVPPAPKNMPAPSIAFHDTRRGTIAHFLADQCIGVSLQRYGEWAESEISFLQPFVQPGATVLDVGANVGSHTLAFAEMVGPAGKVIAIEGQLSTFGLLSHNIVANGLMDRVTALPALAGSEPSLVACSLSPLTDNAGAKSFFAEVHGRDVHGTPADHLPAQVKGMPVSLALITIDSLDLSSCALIKIDVEGMELDVLRGAQETICRTHPAIYFEQAAGASSGLAEISALLSKAGYRLFWHTARAYNPENYKSDPHNVFGDATETNVIAIPDTVPPPPGMEEVKMA
ncbi:FkbM family methyltransferase [Methylobacterium symbioticum]|uniref:FkbM family methyltransferase n=1 Tax=Methylobacterium symbioticum TaxID=2584084 RepID=UPI001159A83C|nr:FkbM family methyltransferase [Methylobacterium symbioticum]